ncbi:helix-turn-helix transcriptional regulator [Bradyrhizobium pachyrhizi]|uniref:helix-turn-helix transcriptional regulator n=1 Tax=Bradyrhizobium pachyrhizi TaxID=280333 RepID=UPI003D36B15D
MQLLKLADVMKVTSLARSTIYSQMDAGRFPRPLKVGSAGVRWDIRDLQAWRDSLPIANDNQPTDMRVAN